ncbi:MAG: hypothetical protein D6713_10640 [Deltaproteobacteria bacterium]|nr:MAG: hypothetical protein D6713_10640 [Deltaproteobacteria bacterium]
MDGALALRRAVGSILLAVLFVFAVPGTAPAGEGENLCPVNEGPCVAEAGGIHVTFDLAPKPVRTMKPLTVRVRLEGATPLPETLSVSFEMPGMVMGENVSVLRRVRGNLFEGEAFIVRCPSGDTLWKATVRSEKGPLAEFLFHVDKP